MGMQCLDGIGRESWDWEVPYVLASLLSPHGVGEEALAEVRQPTGVNLSSASRSELNNYCYIILIMDDPPWASPSQKVARHHSASACFSKS